MFSRFKNMLKNNKIIQILLNFKRNNSAACIISISSEIFKMFNAKQTTNNVQVSVRQITKSLNCQPDFCYFIFFICSL